MFLIVVLTVLWIIHGYVAWKVIPTLGLTSSGGITAYILVFILSILPLLPILLRYSGSETKFIDRISLVGYTSLGFFVLSFLILSVSPPFKLLIIDNVSSVELSSTKITSKFRPIHFFFIS